MPSFRHVFAPVMVLFLLVWGCTSEQAADLDDALALYRENELENALPLFERVVDQQNDHVEARTWLAETYRRLGMKDEAVKTAAKALEQEPCNSFAHTIIADACRRPPGERGLKDSDTTWVHLCKAVSCDSTDGNPWASIWCEAILREKFELMQKSVRKMKETGFLTKAVLAYARWMLRSLPENAILLTNGDMDTFPPLALQVTEGFRPDVVVVERGQLDLIQFLRYIRDHCAVPLPFPDSDLDSLTRLEDGHGNVISVSDQIFRGWVDLAISGSFPRPIALSVTVDEIFFTGFKEYLRYSGPFLLLHSTPVEGAPATDLLERSLADIRAEDFTGPWTSVKDRSPVRGLYTKYIAANVTEAALAFGEGLIKERKYNEAKKILSWAEEYEKTTELGSVFGERISRLKETAEAKETD